MASSSHHGHWEAPTFHFNSPNQSEDWSAFYTRALDYLDTLDIELDTADESHKGWKQLKLMFEGEDRKALQSLIDSGVMTPEHMLKPKAALDAIGMTIKSEEHFGPTGMSLCQTCNSCQMKGSMCCLSSYVTSLPSQNLAMLKQLKQLKLWSCNMVSSTMRPGTGLGYRTSPSSHIRPSSHIVKCLKLTVSSIRKLRRGVMPIWPQYCCHIFLAHRCIVKVTKLL